MRLLIITQGYSPGRGGTEIVMQKIAEHLVREWGDAVTVITTNCYNGDGFYTPSAAKLPTGWEHINGVRVLRMSVASKLSLIARWAQAIPYRLHLPGNERLRAWSSGPIIPGLAQEIGRLLSEHDVVLASSHPLLHMEMAQRTAYLHNKPCVLYGCMHPEDDWGFNRKSIDLINRNATTYLANTTHEQKYVISRGVAPERVVITGVGVDSDALNGPPMSSARQAMGLPAQVPIIGYVGQLNSHKGVDTLLDTAKTLWRERPDLHFVIAGARTNFSARILEPKIQQLQHTHSKQLHFFPNFPEEKKSLLFRSLNIFVYPSGFESFGVAFLEAWAARVPVIGCDRGAIPSVIASGRDGLLIPFQDADALGAAITTLLENPEWAHELANRGYAKVTEKFTWSKVTHRFRNGLLRANDARN